MRRCISGTFLVPIFASVYCAAQPEQSARFEVASIKPVGKDVRMRFSQDAGQISWTRIPLISLIGDVYNVHLDQITGPDWLSTEFFAIIAKLPLGATRDQYPQMMENLLAERFGLVVHRITKDVSGYELTVASGGPRQLTPANPDVATDAPPAAPGRGGFERPMPDKNGFPINSPGVTWVSRFDDGMMKMTFRQGTMAFLAARLRDILTQSGSGETVPITDHTGISGEFNFHLEILASANGYPDVGPRDISAALEKQLGLKLNSAKTKLDFIVVDHVNRVPTEN